MFLPQMSEEINLSIKTLESGLKVISLMGTIRFDDGTQVDQTWILKLRNRQMMQDYEYDEELVSRTVGSKILEEGKFKLKKRLVVPRMEVYQEIMKVIPKDCIVLVREFIAEAWGFPFVCPITTGQSGRTYLSDCFFSA